MNFTKAKAGPRFEYAHHLIIKILFFRPTAPVPTIPGGLDSQTSIRINDETFLIEADDLESQCVLGRGAYGVVEKVKHKQTGTILAVKVRTFMLNIEM